ncbi:EMILIN-3 [Neosynchiropus ocellatus]
MVVGYVFIFALCLALGQARFYRPLQMSQYHHAGELHHQGKPTSRYKNHCAYVVEKTMSFTMQDGVAPYVKAEYNKCSWGKKCPTLLYRMMYKPIYKVAHKSVTELEWRCCPGYSGYGCIEGPPAYQHPVKSMPPFKGPPFKGPPRKGPIFKGPMFKGPAHKGPMFKGPMMKGPMLKGPPTNYGMKSSQQMQPQGPPSSIFHYPMRHFGPPGSSSFPATSFEPYPSEPEPDHLETHQPEPDHIGTHHPDPDHLEGHHAEEDHIETHLSEPDHIETHHGEPDHIDSLQTEVEVNHELEQGRGPQRHVTQEATPISQGEDTPGQTAGQPLDPETEERLYRMEEDVQRLNQGFETLRGTVNGLEESLRASLREDANRMLSALLSAGPGPVPAQAVASSSSTVGFAEIPGGDPQIEGLDSRHVIPSLTDLNSKVEELRTELKTKTAELQELKATILTHDGALRRIAGGDGSDSGRPGKETHTVETLLDDKLNAARVDILGGFEKRVETVEGRCEERAGDVRRQCQREQSESQKEIESSLEEASGDLRAELRNLHTQIQGIKAQDSCCAIMSGLGERVQLLETSLAGLNQSQSHLRVELGGHKDHIEGVLEGRLAYVESKLNLTSQPKNDEHGQRHVSFDPAEEGQGMEARMEGKMKALEGRLLTALEELGNATAPVLLEGHAVPTLELELESLRGRLELDVDRLQKQLISLESLCSSSSSTPPNTISPQKEPDNRSDNIEEEIGLHGDRLDSLNITMQNIMRHLELKNQQDQEEGDSSIQGALTVLQFNVHSVNRTLKGLQDSLGTVVHQVGQANNSWHEREARLAQQMKGVVQLVGHQASMLGTGERRLTRLKGELQEMKRRLVEEVRGCRSTAMGVKKEVSEVGGRVATVEDKCKGLNYLADDLETIRQELEKQSNGLLLQFNGTLSNHARQLSDLRSELRNCTIRLESTQVLQLEEDSRRGDTFTSD